MVDAVRPIPSALGGLPGLLSRPSGSGGPRPEPDRVRPTSTRVAFSPRENGDILVRVVDGATGELIRQIPPEAELKLAAAVTALARRFLGLDG